MSQTQTTPYAEAVAERAAIEAALREEESRHTEAKRRLGDRLDAVRRQITAADAGLCGADDVATGQRVLSVMWVKARRYNLGREEAAVIAEVIDAAVRDLQEGLPRLRGTYFGVKAYDRWSAQRSDSSYGFSPKHGSIWFRVGLRHPALAGEVTEEDRQACIRYLRAVQENPEAVLI